MPRSSAELIRRGLFSRTRAAMFRLPETLRLMVRFRSIRSTRRRNIILGGQRILSNAGENNLFIGLDTGQNNSTGLSNTFVGTYAGKMNTVGNFNSFFGRSAGEENTSGLNNSFFGVLAGRQ